MFDFMEQSEEEEEFLDELDAYYSGQETCDPTSEVEFNDEADSEEREFSQDIELDTYSLTLFADKKRHSGIIISLPR